MINTINDGLSGYCSSRWKRLFRSISWFQSLASTLDTLRTNSDRCFSFDVHFNRCLSSVLFDLHSIAFTTTIFNEKIQTYWSIRCLSSKWIERRSFNSSNNAQIRIRYQIRKNSSIVLEFETKFDSNIFIRHNIR